MIMTVACVLRSGGDFTAEYVARLRAAIGEHWGEGDLDFLCLTDMVVRLPGVRTLPLLHGWPGYWSKLELFRPDIPGDLLYFDLDTLIIGPMAEIRRVRCHTLLQSFQWRRRLASGMMFLPAAVRPVIWDQWMVRPREWMKEHRWGRSNGRLPGDQGFLQETWERWGWGPAEPVTEDWRRNGIRRWQQLLPGMIFSYKHHIRGKSVPPGARVICFHGNPRPHMLDWRLPG